MSLVGGMRFFLRAEVWPTGVEEVILEGAEGHHAVSVMRVAVGDAVDVFDGEGRAGVGRVAALEKKWVRVRIEAERFSPRPSGRLALAVAIPKKSTIEWIIEKAVELGVSDVVPLLTRRTVVRLDTADRPDRQRKWERAAMEAAKQCRQDWLPKIHEPQPLENAILSLPPSEFTLPLVACLQPDARPLADVVRQAGALPPTGAETGGAVWIGPEGDFTDEEVALLRESGLVPVSLGRLVLRVETAALYALSVLRFCTSG
ncbi:MAG: RsmE family RNA methyltransferase [Verrucomicrobiales bacterium]